MSARDDMRRTFRGVPGQIERAFEQLGASGVFHANRNRLIEGIAVTSATNSHGYAYAPLGCSYKMPLPLLYRHDWDRPIGMVYEAERTPTKIYFKARVADGYFDDIDSIWQRISTGKIFGVSCDASHFGDGRRTRLDAEIVWNKWTWCELSVSDGMGANPDARILVAREIEGNRETIHRDARPPLPVVHL